MFVASLDVDETLALLLVAEGFTELEEVAYVELQEVASIEGFDEDLAQELQARAKDALAARDEKAAEERRELGVSDDLSTIAGLNEQMLLQLGQAEIKTLDDLGDLATDELISAEDGILKDFGLSEEEGLSLIHI